MLILVALLFCFHQNHQQKHKQKRKYFSVQNKWQIITQPLLHPNLNFESLKCEGKLVENKDQ